MEELYSAELFAELTKLKITFESFCTTQFSDTKQIDNHAKGLPQYSHASVAETTSFLQRCGYRYFHFTKLCKKCSDDYFTSALSTAVIFLEDVSDQFMTAPQQSDSCGLHLCI